jgi:hypothetical protein
MEHICADGGNRGDVIAASGGAHNAGQPDQEGNGLHGFRPQENKEVMAFNMGRKLAGANFQKTKREPSGSQRIARDLVISQQRGAERGYARRSAKKPRNRRLEASITSSSTCHDSCNHIRAASSTISFLALWQSWPSRGCSLSVAAAR